jgi:hypothetical protein
MAATNAAEASTEATIFEAESASASVVVLVSVAVASALALALSLEALVPLDSLLAVVVAGAPSAA